MLKYPSCAKLLKYVKVISDSQIDYCDARSEEQLNDDVATNLQNSESIDSRALKSLLIEMHALREEVIVLKESNIDLVRLLQTQRQCFE